MKINFKAIMTFNINQWLVILSEKLTNLWPAISPSPTFHLEILSEELHLREKILSSMLLRGF